MVTIDISIEDFSELLGKKEALTVVELDKYLAFAKAEVDSDPEGPDENGHTKISVDVKTANRPDLWSAEGLAREIRGMLDKPGLPNFKFPSSTYEIIVDESVKEIRPYIGAVIAKGLKLDNFLIKQFIQAQDKLDFSFGRKRKRTSIGLYNLHLISSPIQYTTVGRDFKFVPLQFDKELTVDEIFKQHPKGIEYENILKPFTMVPMLIDSNNRVLSMPPIINSNDVGRITESTENVLLEVTGTNEIAVNQVTDLFAQILQDRGAKVESVLINYHSKTIITPTQSTLKMNLTKKEVNRYLGTRFSEARLLKLLRKRRLDAKDHGDQLQVELPPYRQDVIHWVDLSEEIAIASDYNLFNVRIPNLFTQGALDLSTEKENMIREIMVGASLQEILNYNLTDLDSVVTKMSRGLDFKNKVVYLKNPVSQSYSILRPDLLSGLIRFTSKNIEAPFPHHIFETGEITIYKNNIPVTKTHLAVLLAGANETFETSHRILDAFFNSIKVKYKLEVSEMSELIDGRSATVFSEDSTKLGAIGEVKIEVLENFGIKVPVSCFELDLTKIKKLKLKKYSPNNY